MGTITVSISDDAEEWLRKSAGKGKGNIGRTITSALRHLKEEDKQKNIAEDALKILRKRWHTGGKLWKTREELHERG